MQIGSNHCCQILSINENWPKIYFLRESEYLNCFDCLATYGPTLIWLIVLISQSSSVNLKWSLYLLLFRSFLRRSSSRRSDHGNCILKLICTRFEFGASDTFSWIIIFLHNFVFLNHNKKNCTSASTLWDHGRNYTWRSTLVSWPDTCNSGLGASIFLEGSFG